jgi:hypothetical protein
MTEVAAYAADSSNAPEYCNTVRSIEWRTQLPIAVSSEMGFAGLVRHDQRTLLASRGMWNGSDECVVRPRGGVAFWRQPVFNEGVN